MYIENKQSFLSRYNQLEQEYQKWSPIHQQIASYFNPTRGSFSPSTADESKKINSRFLYTMIGPQCIDILAKGFASGLTKKNTQWFKIGTEDPDLNKYYTAQEYLEQVNAILYYTFSESNLYTMLQNMYKETPTFGSGCAIILDDFQSGIRTESFTAGEYFLGIGKNGKIDAFSRQYSMTVGQCVSTFGINNVTYTTKQLYQKGLVDTWVSIRHVIQKNEDWIEGDRYRLDFPYLSVYWETSSDYKEVLRYSGFYEFPIVAPRWETVCSSDIYGRGPAWYALGDIQTLNAFERDLITGEQKMINPPVQINESVIQNPYDVNVSAGAIVPYKSNGSGPIDGGLKPAYQVDLRLQEWQAIKIARQNDIKSLFYTDLFLSLTSRIDGRTRTAREIIELNSEKIMILGPVIDNINLELLDPAINITFNKLERAGVIPPKPKELKNKRFKIDYISMFSQAKKQQEALSIEQLMAFSGNLMASYPDVKDNIDEDEVLRSYAMMIGSTPKVLRSPEATVQVRKERANAQLQMQQTQNMNAMVQGAKVLSDTPVGTNSALDYVMGTR